MRKIKQIIIYLIIIGCLNISINCYAETGKINVSAARLREEPNTTSNIITNVYNQDKVQILETSGEWYKVKYGNNIGYIKSEFIIKDKNSSSETGTENANSNTNTLSNNENISNTLKNNTSPNSTNAVSNNNLNTQTQTNDNTQMKNQSIDDIKDNDKFLISQSIDVRLLPNLMSKLFGHIDSGKELTKISSIGSWIQVTDGIYAGWVLKNKISIADTSEPNEPKVQEPEQLPTNSDNENKPKEQEKPELPLNKIGIVNVETAKVRESANSSATITGFLDYYDEITIVGEEGDWYKFTSKKVSGYVNKGLIKIKTDAVSSRGLEEDRRKDGTAVSREQNDNLTTALSEMPSNSGEDVADYAKQFLNCSYVVGGKNPNTGFDCSGFTRYVYLNFGYSLGNTASSQDGIGDEVERENLLVGDLILFYDDAKTKIGHTGIYLGNGEFIHAANPSRGVVTDNLNTSSYYNTRFITARRIVK